uniref:Uncharacterized protein n=1 Tax=Aplanochytrium stocchinoi TaxID=215587 RepID=A0A7S3LLX2_9STRA|mmetsp:Transcript_18612/g.22742  ORF Transcript_18612/g.22742 Transcript_18612/m.22742 type:complete len:123 (+) Transcript_18612:218-586(+)
MRNVIDLTLPFTAHNLNQTWKQTGCEAPKAKVVGAIHVLEKEAYDVLPLVMETMGCPGNRLAAFSTNVENNPGQYYNKSDDEPSVNRSQFALKWNWRMVLAFKKTQAQAMQQTTVTRGSHPR